MFELVPICERWIGEAPEWVPPSPSGAFEWIVLGPDTSDSDIAYVIAELARCSDVPADADLHHTLKKIYQERTLILSGGLLAKSNGIEIGPSCCCGLEGWREWYGVKPGGSPPWLGHDPSPWIECRTDCAVIWADGGLGEELTGTLSIKVGYEELRIALDKAEQDLIGFRDRLSQWIRQHAPVHTKLHWHFSRQFHLPSN